MFLLSSLASAQTPPPPPDVSVSSIGVQTWSDSALRGAEAGSTDLDLLVGQRLRWTVAGDGVGSGPDLIALADARFTVDPGPDGTPPFEWSQVRQLGLQYRTDRWIVDLGRALVYRGGPRLVDGVQALYAPGPQVRLGVWAGLAPDLFTTLPEIRPGGGPILAWERSASAVTLVGEVLTWEGALDRAATLLLARHTIERTLDLSGRLDVELAGDEGPRLVDGYAGVGFDPAPALRIDVFYDAFSSYRYLETELLDPDLQRFVDRAADAGVDLVPVVETRDPTLNHLVGGSARVQPNVDGAAPRLGLLARHRQHPDPANRYTRINPQAGVVNVGGSFDLLADLNWIAVDETQQIDAGLQAVLEPGGGAFALDGSVRVISAPEEFPGPTFYVDLYANVVSADLDLVFIAGASALSEPDVLDEQDSFGTGVFLRMAKYVRSRR